MFEKFTEKSVKVVLFAQEESRRLGARAVEEIEYSEDQQHPLRLPSPADAPPATRCPTRASTAAAEHTAESAEGVFLAQLRDCQPHPRVHGEAGRRVISSSAALRLAGISCRTSMVPVPWYSNYGALPYQ